MPNKLGSFLQNLRRAPHRQDALGKIDPWSIRSRSLARAERLGYPVNPTLPLLDPPTHERSVDEVLGRALCLHVVIACAKGFDRDEGRKWLEQESAFEALTPNEREYLQSGTEDRESYLAEVESLWTLLWTLRIVRRLNFAYPFDEDMFFLLPNLARNEDAGEVREKQKLRPVGVIFQQLDLAYCLDASVADASSKDHRIPGTVSPSVIQHRQRALAWVVGTDAW